MHRSVLHAVPTLGFRLFRFLEPVPLYFVHENLIYIPTVYFVAEEDLEYIVTIY